MYKPNPKFTKGLVFHSHLIFYDVMLYDLNLYVIKISYIAFVVIHFLCNFNLFSPSYYSWMQGSQ